MILRMRVGRRRIGLQRWVSDLGFRNGIGWMEGGGWHGGAYIATAMALGVPLYRIIVDSSGGGSERRVAGRLMFCTARWTALPTKLRSYRYGYGYGIIWNTKHVTTTTPPTGHEPGKRNKS